MRYLLACILSLSLWPTSGWSQSLRSSNSGSVPRHALPIPPIGNEFGDRRHCHGPSPAYGGGYGVGYYSPGYGYSYSNYSPFGFNPLGYTGVYYGTPGFGVGYSMPLSGNIYYGPAWENLGWGTPAYGVPQYTVNPQPQLPDLPQWMLDEAQVGQTFGTKTRPISQAHRSLVEPSTPEAQLRSVRLQDTGDRLFVKLDYTAAEKSYAKSLQAAPDRPDPYVRLAMAKAARGDFRGAVSYLKQMADVDATYPARADSLGKLFGHHQGIAKLQLKQRVADWAKVDVRDPDRLFLLGVILFLEGDDRFRTLLDTAALLDGKQVYFTAFLETVPAQDAPNPNVVAPTPDEIDALTVPQSPPVGEPRKPTEPTTGPAPLLLPAPTDPPTP